MHRFVPILVFAALAPGLLADVAPPDQKPVRHEVWFEGLDDPSFGGQRFYLYRCYPLNRPVVEVLAGTPVLGMRNCAPSLYAVQGKPPEGDEALQAFFSGPACAGSSPIRFVNYVSRLASTRKVVTVYLVRRDGASLVLEKTREEFLDSDGHPVGPLGRPPALLAAGAASLLALAALAGLAVRRRRRHG